MLYILYAYVIIFIMLLLFLNIHKNIFVIWFSFDLFTACYYNYDDKRGR